MSDSVFALDHKPYTFPAYIALVLVLAAVCFGSLTDHLFYTHDDEIALDYPRLSADPAFFFDPDKANASGRLIDELVMWAAYAAWGDDPALFHLLSVASHVLASLVLALAYHRLGANREMSLIAGLLFLLNITHIQAVHWISALEYPLALLIIAAAAYYYGAHAADPSPARLALFYALAATGLLTHIAALMLWPFCLCWSLLGDRGWRRTLRELVPLALLLVPVLYLVVQMTPARTSTFDAATSYSADQALPLLGGSGRALLWFAGRLLSTAHWLPLAPHDRPLWEEGLGLLVLAGLGLLIGRRITVAPWAAWTLLFLVPFLALPERILSDLPIGPSRYLYLASAGSSLLLAWLLQQVGLWAARRGKASRGVYACALIALFAANGYAIKKAEALAFYMSSRHYLASGDEETGTMLLQRAIDWGPDIINLQDAYERLAVMRLLEPERIADFTASALAQFPDSGTLQIINLVHRSTGLDPASQSQVIAKLDALAGDPDFADLIGLSYHNLGVGLQNKGAIKQAVAAFRLSLRFLPDRPATLRYLGAALHQQGDLAGSSAAMERSAQLTPNDPQAQYNAALGLQRLGKPDRAIEYARAALAIQPTADTHLLIGLCFQRLGRADEARNAYRRSIALDPRQFHAYTQLAAMLAPDQAIATLERADAAGNDNPELFKRLGNLYFQSGDTQRADRLYRRAIAVDPDNTQAHANLGLILEATGDLAGARAAFARASELAPLDPRYHGRLADLARVAGDLPAAIGHYRRTLALNPQDSAARTNLGWLLYRQGEFAAAVEHFRTVVDRTPNSAAQFNLGLALLAQGDTDSARAAYAEAVRRYGAAEAEQIGATADLRALIDTGLDAARDIYRTYWP